MHSLPSWLMVTRMVEEDFPRWISLILSVATEGKSKRKKLPLHAQYIGLVVFVVRCGERNLELLDASWT